jgi:hypothetical protein
VVEQDKGSEDPILFNDITFYESPGAGQEKMVEQLQHLHLRLFGNHVESDGPEIEANLELWQNLFEVEASTTDAWAGVLSVLLRDPEFLVY